MRNFKIFPAVLVLFAAFNIVSCGDTEPVDPVALVPTIPGQIGDCSDPIGFQASNFINGTNVNLSWIPGDEETQWQVEYGATGFEPGDGTIMVSQNTNLTVTGLNPAGGYNFYVRAMCPDGGFSNWVGPVSVGTGTVGCGLPTDLSAVRTDANLTQVVVTWTPAGSATQWEIEYGFAGHTPGTGTSVFSTTPTKTLTGLSQNQDFHVYVRSVCGPGETSYWAGPFTVEAINAMAVNINADAFVPTGVAAAITTVDDVEYIEVSGTNDAGDAVNVLVKKTLGVGTYHDAPDVLLSYKIGADTLSADTTMPATVTITEKTPHSMVGTFSFTATNEVPTGSVVYVLTSGSFAVTF